MTQVSGGPVDQEHPAELSDEGAVEIVRTANDGEAEASDEQLDDIAPSEEDAEEPADEYLGDANAVSVVRGPALMLMEQAKRLRKAGIDVRIELPEGADAFSAEEGTIYVSPEDREKARQVLGIVI